MRKGYPEWKLQKYLEEILKKSLTELVQQSFGGIPAQTTDSNYARIFEGIPQKKSWSLLNKALVYFFKKHLYL